MVNHPPAHMPGLPWAALARRPLLVCSVCFLAGIVGADVRLINMMTSATICLLAVVVILAARRTTLLSSIGVLVAFAMLGAFAHATRMAIPASDISHLAGASKAVVEGTVVSSPQVRDRYSTFTLLASSVRTPHPPLSHTVTGRAHVSVLLEDPVSEGDHVRLSGATVSLLGSATHTDISGYTGWLRRQGITTEVRADAISLLAPADGRAPLGAILRNRVVGAIERAMPGSDSDFYAHLLVGMVYGLQAAPLPESTVEDFRRAGTVHLLVVSGAQVTMLAGAILWLMGVKLRSPRWWHIVLSAVAVLMLVLIVGLGASVARAVAMFALLAIAALSSRDYDLPTTIGFAAMVICLFDSNALFSLGFQLTFAATIGVAVFLPDGPLLMINRDRAPASIRALRAVLWGTIGAWLMVTPLLAHAFSGFAFLGNVANIVNVPLSGLVMVLGFVALPLAFIGAPMHWLLTAVCAVARVLLDLVMGINWLAGALPLAYVDGLSLSTFGCVLWYVLVAALLLTGLVARAHRRLDRALVLTHPGWVPIGAALAIAAIWLAHAVTALPSSDLQVTFLPVGAGQCAIARSPSGATMMLDCGAGGGLPDAGERVADGIIRPWLARRRIRRLDMVLLTHWDADHYNALPHVLAATHLGGVLRPVTLRDAVPPQELARLLPMPNAVATAGGVIDLGGGVVGQVLAPRLPRITGGGDDANNNSTVLRMTLGERAILFTGDIEAEGLERLARDATAGGIDLTADVVCLPHHGRALRDSEGLLELSRPRWAIASCDRQANHYLGSAGEAWLQERGIRLLRTDVHGAVTITTDGSSLRVRTQRGSVARAPARAAQ